MKSPTNDANESAPDLLIAGGRMIDPGNGVDQVCDVYVAQGKVAALRAPAKRSKKFDGVRIDADGLMVLPGLIDLCARLRQPSEAHKAITKTEARAAARGGIARIVCPPDAFPVIDTPAMARMLQDRAAAYGFTRVHPLGALTVGLDGERLADMALLMDAGCVGVSNGLRAVGNTLVMRRAMQYAATYDLAVFTTPRDAWLQGNCVVHEGAVSTRLGLPAIPEAAETVGVARDLALIETSGARAHFDLISSGRAVEMIAEAKTRGLPVSAGVAIHHLHLNEGDIGAFDAQCKVFPPLRTERDQRALLRGIADGTINAICSDHQPHSADAKLAPFAEAAAGIAGVDTLLALTMRLVDQDALPLDAAIAALTAKPAAVIGIDAGHLGVGAVADLCLFDPTKEWTLSPETMRSDGRNSPWLGSALRGKVVAAVIDGAVV
ncbi:MAG: dihydroorotase [bacterium]